MHKYINVEVSIDRTFIRNVLNCKMSLVVSLESVLGNDSLVASEEKR